MAQRGFDNRTNRLTNRTNLALGAGIVVVMVVSGIFLLTGPEDEHPSTAEPPKTETPGATPPAPTSPGPGEKKRATLRPNGFTD